MANTEALVFLTVVHNYDLTNPVHGITGNVLSRLFGGGSW